MLLGDPIRKAVAKVQTGGMDSSAPATVSVGNATGARRGYVDDLKGEGSQDVRYLVAEISARCYDKQLCKCPG